MSGRRKRGGIKSEIENRIKAREQAFGKISDNPALLLARLDRGEAVDPEPYLGISIQWLPRRSSDAAIERGLRELARLFLIRHRDRWLSDVLAAPVSSADGLTALAAAADANRADRASQALEESARAATLLRSSGNRAAALRAEADRVYAIHRTFRNADECVRRAAVLERDAASLGYRWIQSQAAIELGVCREIAGDSGAAYEDLRRALASAESAGLSILALRAEGILASSQTAAGDVVTGWNRARAGLSRYWAGSYPGSRAQQLYVVGSRAAESLDLLHTARAFKSAEVDSIAGSSDGFLEAIGRVRTAGLALQTGFPEVARLEYAKAEGVFARLGSSPEMESRRIYAEIFMAKADHALGHPKMALERLELFSRRAVATGSLPIQIMLHEAAGEAYLSDGQWQRAEQEFRLAIEHTERRLASLSGFEDRSAALLASSASFRGIAEIEWTNKKDSAAAFRAMERFRSIAAETPDLAAFSRETFLSYADLPSGLVVWVFDDRGLSCHRLAAKPAEVALRAKKLARLCSDPASSSSELNAEARRMYEWLLAPVAASLDPARTLVIVPDVSTSGVVFSALLDESNRPLSDRYATVIASSAADYYRRHRAGPLGGTTNALVVANPLVGAEGARSFPPLRQAEKEGRAVASRLGASTTTVLSGAEATLANVNRHRPLASLVHFAGHGFSNSGNSGLVLAPPGDSTMPFDVLDGSRLASQDWSRCRLAVLSACSSGSGESKGPVNPESLVRRLLWAGASRVVASRWNADAESSLTFMDHFYSGLASGREAPEALRLAAREVRASPMTSHPYFWAGFQTFGSR